MNSGREKKWILGNILSSLDLYKPTQVCLLKPSRFDYLLHCTVGLAKRTIVCVCATCFPHFLHFVTLKRQGKTREPKSRSAPLQRLWWSWGLRTHAPASESATQPAQLIACARIAPCALTSAAPSLHRSSAVSLLLKAHTVQIIKHLWGILHFHESINSELFLNMLRPYTPRFLSIICRRAGVASSCMQKVRLELASYLQACFSRSWA